jgi:hypothetical protein
MTQSVIKGVTTRSVGTISKRAGVQH